jgi:hypothetical protein
MPATVYAYAILLEFKQQSLHPTRQSLMGETPRRSFALGVSQGETTRYRAASRREDRAGSP